MKKILVPTDFSDEATYALDLATDIAKVSGAEVMLLNVIEHPYHASAVHFDVEDFNPEDQMFIIQMRKVSSKKLKEIQDDPKYADVKLHPKITIGSPFRSISDEISNFQANLVVMGTHGASGLEEILIGSNAEKVVRSAKCPVLTLKQPVKAADINNIVFAASFHEKNDNVMKALVKLQKLFDAKLHLLKVNTPSNFDTDRHAHQMVEDFVKQYNITNYTINTYNDNSEEDGIIYFSEDINADMIAMATHGRNNLFHLITGSIAEDIVNHATRPVWTFSMKNK